MAWLSKLLTSIITNLAMKVISWATAKFKEWNDAKKAEKKSEEEAKAIRKMIENADTIEEKQRAALENARNSRSKSDS